MKFFGRQIDLNRLSAFVAKKGTGLVCIRGRRRIGKSYFLKKFTSEAFNCFFIDGRNDESTKNAQQRIALEWEKFTKKEGRHDASLIRSKTEFLNWDLILDTFCKDAKTCKKPLVIIIDEIQWLAKQQSGFIGALKEKWPSWQSTNNIKLIIAGSSRKFFEEQLDNAKAPLFGMVTHSDIELQPFTLREVQTYWFPQWSNEEICLLYMIVGGVPYYLEQIAAQEDENFLRAVNAAMFTKAGIFLKELHNILELEFAANMENVVRVMASLGQAGATQESICESTGLPKTTAYNILQNLLDYKIVYQRMPFGEKRKANRRGVRFYMKDFYLNFYFQVLRKAEPDILQNITGGMLFRYEIAADAGFYIPNFSGKAFELLITTVLENKSDMSPGIFQALRVSSRKYEVGTYWEEGKTQIDIILEDDSDRETRIIEAKWINSKADANSKDYIRQVKDKQYKQPNEYRVTHYLALSRGFTKAFAQSAQDQQIKIIELEDLFGDKHF